MPRRAPHTPDKPSARPKRAAPRAASAGAGAAVAPNELLADYRRKRRFSRTPEPSGAAHAEPAHNRFVIHKHDASRLHYDFRLEYDGVLKSWAVPKGPSLDPHERHLAVQVEDHPIEYGAFEGTIPAGEYGGGTVMLWDRGTWTPLGSAEEGLRTGRLKFTLQGEKLRGKWTLVRMGGAAGEDGKNWLLIKERDGEVRPAGEYDVRAARPDSVATGRTMEQIAAENDAVWKTNRPAKTRRSARPTRLANGRMPRAGHRRTAADTETHRSVQVEEAPLDPARLPQARRAAQPRTLHAQLATLTDEVPEGDEWLHEIKFDGYRMICFLEQGQARLISRNEHDWTGRFPSVAAACEQLAGEPNVLPHKQAILDGEVVVLRPDGTTDFQALQNALKGGRGARPDLLRVRPAPLRRLRPDAHAIAGAQGAVAAVAAAGRERSRCCATATTFAGRGPSVLSQRVQALDGRAGFQACGQHLRAAPRAHLGEDQMPAAAGVRHRRVHEPGRNPDGFWGAALGLLRRRPAGVLRQGRHRLQRGVAAQHPRPVAAARAKDPGVRQSAARGRSAPGPLGAARAGRRDRILRMDRRRPAATPDVPGLAARKGRARRRARTATKGGRAGGTGRRSVCSDRRTCGQRVESSAQRVGRDLAPRAIGRRCARRGESRSSPACGSRTRTRCSIPKRG